MVLYDSLGAVFWIFLAFYGLRMRLITSDWVDNKATIVTQNNYGLFGLTYNCAVLYSYEADGNAFNGTRVNVWAGGVSPGFCNELKVYKEEKKSFKIYTDPKNPSESIIDKRLSTLWYSFIVLCYVVHITHVYLHFASDPTSDKDGLLIQLFLFGGIPFLSVFWIIVTNITESMLDALLACGFCYLSATYIAAGIVQSNRNRDQVIVNGVPVTVNLESIP